MKRGAGSTNDGNTARHLFACPSEVSKITGFNENLLIKFAIILDTLACGLEVNADKFKEYCLEAAKNFEALYPWYKIPSSVHLVLIHGADIMKSLEMPIGAHSDEALEPQNKNIRAFRY